MKRKPTTAKANKRRFERRRRGDRLPGNSPETEPHKVKTSPTPRESDATGASPALNETPGGEPLSASAPKDASSSEESLERESPVEPTRNVPQVETEPTPTPGNGEHLDAEHLHTEHLHTEHLDAEHLDAEHLDAGGVDAEAARAGLLAGNPMRSERMLSAEAPPPSTSGVQSVPDIEPTLQHEAQRAPGDLRASGVRIGQVLADKYRVERVLGMGGMGVVVAATHLQLGREVAVKLMRPDVLGDDSAVQRALGEAQAAARIGSEHVTRVMDVGSLDGSKPYIVMEYLAGEDLAAMLARGPLSTSDAVDYTLQACEALAEAHQQGIVHCDLKPGNLFVTRLADGSKCIKVMDFGIAKRSGPEGLSTGLTSHSGVVGSAHYMSPEQMQGKPVDSSADIWSLGTLLYEMVTGKQTFAGNTWPEVCSQVFEGTATPLHELDARIAPEFEAVVARCLMRQPAERYASVGELAEALKPFASAAGRMSCERILRVLGGGAPDSERFSSIGPPPGVQASPQPPASRSRLWAGLAVVGLGLVAVLALVLSRANRQPVATQATAASQPRPVQPEALRKTDWSAKSRMAQARPTPERGPKKGSEPAPASPSATDSVSPAPPQTAAASALTKTENDTSATSPPPSPPKVESEATPASPKSQAKVRRRTKARKVTRARKATKAATARKATKPSRARKVSARSPAKQQAARENDRPKPPASANESQPGDAWNSRNYGPRK